MNRRLEKKLVVVYSNVQGYNGKKDSVTEIAETLECDVLLLTETMTTNVRMAGYKCITAKKSVGQDVAIILRGKLSGVVPMRLYEPNDTINMLGIRIEVAKNNFQRFYTSHMKQVSVNAKEIIRDQFSEIRQQFRQAAVCSEGMLLVCDANVHVGSSGIPGCEDVQNWAGAEMMSLIQEEGLQLVNSMEYCQGVVTRVDPRNGNKSTLDLAICNKYLIDEIQKMVIDEKEEYRPTNLLMQSLT